MMAKTTILTIDDSTTVTQIVKDILEREGYRVITASSGKEALEKAKAERPDLILLDIVMPEMDGYKVCHRLKFDYEFQDIPIVMLTAKRKKVDRLRGLEGGADEYLTKPFEAKKLVEVVKELLKLKCRK